AQSGWRGAVPAAERRGHRRQSRCPAARDARSPDTQGHSGSPVPRLRVQPPRSERRTRAGRNGLQVAIALLAPALDESRSDDEVRSRPRVVASGIARTLAADIPGRVGGYDDTFNPRAFGDLIQQWGTSTVLIESGALPDDPEKQRLRAIT